MDATWEPDSTVQVETQQNSITEIYPNTAQQNERWYGWTWLPDSVTILPHMGDAKLSPIMPRTPRPLNDMVSKTNRSQTRRQGMLSCIQTSAMKLRRVRKPRDLDVDLRILNRGLDVSPVRWYLLNRSGSLRSTRLHSGWNAIG